MVVVEDVDQYLTPGRQQRGVLHRHGSGLAGRGGGDADEPGGAVADVGDDGVGEVVGAGLRGGEVEGTGVVVRGDLRSFDLFDGGEAQLLAVGIDVVGERVDDDFLAGDRGDEGEYRHGWQAARGPPRRG